LIEQDWQIMCCFRQTEEVEKRLIEILAGPSVLELTADRNNGF
jgi:hypothetical protein